MLLTDGFEEIEAIATADFLKRLGFTIETARFPGEVNDAEKQSKDMF